MKADKEMLPAFSGAGAGIDVAPPPLPVPPEEHTPWMRRAAASCYFHSGMPHLVRGLRERYEVAGGEGRSFPLRRRKQSSARILYYHRVNDENDPFFDALPTGLFEEQMRYLARHYRVVSLAEIVRHLEGGGSPDTLVGITFDDGYEDNYRNAFPILRRYNLPATIFLTTGPIDSGAPLWFEQLAEAVKKSARESLDLEVGAPQRFWLRSETERLASNRKIFSILRNLSDADRNAWLPEVLRRLGDIGTSERRHKMVTWDQVRRMKGEGIDFGGHTVSHPFLSRLSPPQMAWEVSECKRRIEGELQQPADYFAYPHGREGDFSPATRQALQNAGYKAAMTTIWGVNSPATDRMELRRGGPWENHPALFACKLDWYQLRNE